MTRVVVHIDKLILRGIDRADASAVSAGIQAQLLTRLATPGVAVTLADLGDRHRVKASPAQVNQAAGAQSLGRKVGDSIAKGVVS